MSEEPTNAMGTEAPVTLPEGGNPEPIMRAVPYLRVDASGKILDANDFARDLVASRCTDDEDGQSHLPADIWKPADSASASESGQFEWPVGNRVYLFTATPLPGGSSWELIGLDVSSRKQMEEELRRSARRYHAVVDNIGIGIAIISPGMEILEMNRQMREWFPDVSLTESPKCHRSFNCPGRSEVCTYCPTIKTLRDGLVHEAVTDTPTPSGVRHYTIISSPLKGLQGDVLAAIEMVQDVTDQLNTTRALRESEEMMSAIASAAQDAVVMMDAQGRTMFWNAAAERMFGFTSEEVMGRCLHDLIVPSYIREQANNAILHFRSSGAGDAIGKVRKLTALRKDGTQFPVEVSLSAIYLRNAWHAVGIVRDISDRVAREVEFQRQVDQYMAMINTVPAVMFLKDAEGRYVICNRAFAEAVDRTVPEVIGATSADLFEKDLLVTSIEADEQVLHDGESFHALEQQVGRSGEDPKWISISKVPYHESERIVGLVGLVQDVTELHVSREKLMQADKLAAIGTLAAGVAHEINNPVGFINSNLNTMRKYLAKIRDYVEVNSSGDAEARLSLDEMLVDFGDAIDESLDGADRVRKIVADLKSFSRIDRAASELYNVNEGLETTLNIVWNELKYKATVEKEYGEVPDTFCRGNQLNQVFMNILVNAAHSIVDNGTIRIATRSDGENIYVSITDTGIGIPKDKLEKIFEPFYTTKEAGKGTGLGLSMAHDIVSQHGGRIDAHSEVGVGSEFTVVIPIRGESDGNA